MQRAEDRRQEGRKKEEGRKNSHFVSLSPCPLVPCLPPPSASCLRPPAFFNCFQLPQINANL